MGGGACVQSSVYWLAAALGGPSVIFCQGRKTGSAGVSVLGARHLGMGMVLARNEGMEWVYFKGVFKGGVLIWFWVDGVTLSSTLVLYGMSATAVTSTAVWIWRHFGPRENKSSMVMNRLAIGGSLTTHSQRKRTKFK